MGRRRLWSYGRSNRSCPGNDVLGRNRLTAVRRSALGRQARKHRPALRDVGRHAPSRVPGADVRGGLVAVAPIQRGGRRRGRRRGDERPARLKDAVAWRQIAPTASRRDALAGLSRFAPIPPGGGGGGPGVRLCQRVVYGAARPAPKYFAAGPLTRTHVITANKRQWIAKGTNPWSAPTTT